MRITVNDVLGWLAHGMTEEEILEEHPGLEKEDFAAVYAFATDTADAAYDILPGLETVYDHGLTGSSDPFIFLESNRAVLQVSL